MKKTLFPFCLLVAILAYQAALHAQDSASQIYNPMPEAEYLPDVHLNKKTHPEKIIFSQIKLSDDNPDLNSFAKNSPRVQKAQSIDKTAMEYSEYNRINSNYNMHDKNGIIVAHTYLKLDEYSSLQDMVVFDELDETTFFKFKSYGYNVGLVPEDIAKFSKLALSKPSAEHAFRQLGSNQVALAEFILKPIYADKKMPLMMNGEKLWLMFARIAEFRLWASGDEHKLLWYYRAPWHNLNDNNQLNELFEPEVLESSINQ